MNQGHGRGYPGGVPVAIKFGFGVGKTADAIVSFFFGTLLLIYYNQVLGLPGWLTGMAVMIGLMFDAVTDPAAGTLSDGVKHRRLGRRHPFMLLSIVPASICFWLLFSPPEGLGTAGLFAWLVSFAILTRLATTFFNVPYMAMGAEFTEDYQERTTIVAWRTFFQVFGGAMVAIGVWGYFEANGSDGLDGQLIAANYRVVAGGSSIAIALAILVTCVATLSAIPRLLGSSERPHPFSLSKVYSDLREAMGSQSFRALFTGVFLISVYVGVQAALGAHLLTFYWQLQELEIRNWQLCAGVGGGLAVFMARSVAERLDKRPTVVLGVVIFALSSTGPVALSLIGAMPADRDLLVTTLNLLSAGAAFGGVLAVITGGSMMADIADEHELRYGTRQEGIYFGSLNFAGKATTAFGALIAGITVDAVGLDPNSVPSEVPGEVITQFGTTYCCFVLFMILAIFAIRPYVLNRGRHAEIRDALDARRTELSAG